MARSNAALSFVESLRLNGPVTTAGFVLSPVRPVLSGSDRWVGSGSGERHAGEFVSDDDG